MTGNAANGYEISVSCFIDAPPERVWHALTEQLPEWFCPKPWHVEIVAIEWKAGGRCSMVMHGPNGEQAPNEGIILEVVPGRKWVSTDAFRAGWIPAEPFMIGTFEIEPDGGGTRYTGSARHWTEEAMQRHLDMGFIEGWQTAANQLKALAEAG